MSAKRRKNVGNVKNRSIITTIPLSIKPLKNPALIPMISPIKEAIKAPPTPMMTEVLPPSIILAKISLPSLSVPSGYCKDGDSNIASTFGIKGDCV